MTGVNDKLDESFASKKLWTKSQSKLWTINLFMGTCVLYASRVALPLCATYMAQEYGWNKSDSGTVMSCFFWGYAITQVFAGNFADKVGGEKILVGTTLIWSLLTLLTPQLFDLAHYTSTPLLFHIIIRVLTGIGQGFHLPCMASIVARHLTAADKGRVFGICLAGSHFGTVVAGAVGSILIEAFGWRTLFQFVGCLSVLWWYWFKMLRDAGSNRVRDESSFSTRSVEAGTTEELLQQPSESKVKSARPSTTPVPWKTLFSHPAFWAASVAQYCGANAYFTMFSWLPSYFSDNFPNAKGIVYNVVPSLAIVVTALAAPFIASRLLSSGKSITFTRRFMESTSLVAMALCLLCVSGSSGFYLSLIIFTAAMAARGLHHGGVSVNPHDFAPNHTGSVFGIFNAFSAITGFIGVYIAGWILQSSSNNWSYVFSFTAVQCIFGAIVYAFLGTGNKII
uniref:Major facilitator superfamily (MFS) profile domain-containing protein n=1 Tax=Panagrolaimus superbus TaxID=310955 RepID=A0A914Z0V3_9BILA